MTHRPLPSRPAVSTSKTDRCPECRHRTDDDNHSHFPDCRFFWIDSEADEELDAASMAGGTMPLAL